MYHDVPAHPPLDENPELAAWALETMVRWNDVLRDVVGNLQPVTQEFETDTMM